MRIKRKYLKKCQQANRAQFIALNKEAGRYADYKGGKEY
jgi:hypothetical protein